MQLIANLGRLRGRQCYRAMMYFWEHDVRWYDTELRKVHDLSNLRISTRNPEIRVSILNARADVGIVRW